MSDAAANQAGGYWSTKVRDPLARLRQLLRTADPWASLPPLITVEWSEQPHPYAEAVAWIGTHAPDPMVITLSRPHWRHTGLSAGDALLAGNANLLLTLTHEYLHHADPAWRDCLGLPWLEFRRHGHRSAFQRALALAEGRIIKAGLLRFTTPEQARGRLAPTQQIPREDVPPPEPYPECRGWWPDLFQATRVFAGLPLARVFEVADLYEGGFPEAGAPAAGTVAAWPGSAVSWTVTMPGEADSWCSAGAGVVEVLPNRCLAAMVAAQARQAAPVAACGAS